MEIQDLIVSMILLLVVICSELSHATLEGNVLHTIQERLHAKMNWTGNDPCQIWESVKCYQNHVIELNISGQGLFGTIPREVGHLSFLNVLDLSNNNINGSIPDEISNLINLQTLNLRYNPLSGGFPKVLLKLKKLRHLMLDNSKLSGPLPPNIQQLSSLETLYLGNSSFTGPIPSLGRLVNLKVLTMWGNPLNCTIPSEIGNLTNLEYLNFHDTSMYGRLPPEFGSLHKLKNLSLQDNFFTGTVPDSWISMLSLQSINLFNNRLTGNFPTWISRLNAKIILGCNYLTGPKPVHLDEYSYTGNCLDSDFDSHMKFCVASPNCVFFYSQPENARTSYDLPHNKQNHTRAIAGISVSATLVLLIILVGVYAWKMKKKQKESTKVLLGTRSSAESETSEPWEPPNGLRRFSLKEFLKATEGFSKTYEIGSGGFGKVYKAHIDDGSIVAIKRASPSSIQGHKQFKNEITVLSRLHHRCLVKLEGFCHEAGEQILVYEFMQNGNLNNFIWGENKKQSLSWYKRIEIAVFVAQGLDYLHSFVEPPIIHRDVKPSNILLDEHFSAKLSDFGISKSTPESFNTHISTGPAGTAGYLDPQYFLRRHLSTSSDVYSFGIVLLVLITGKKAIDFNRADELTLVEWVNIKFREGNLKSIVDPLLADDFLPEDFKTVTELALKCAAFERSERPSMKDVLFILEPLLKKTICSNEKNTDLGMFADTISASSSPPPGEHSMSVEAFIAEESPVISRNTSMH